jgi:Ca-activated chloride channel family protein
MSFTWVNMLWLLIIVPILVFCYIIIQRRRQKYALRYASLSLVKEALGRGPGKRRHIPAILFLTGVAFMIFALARPNATVILPSQQSTIILAIDISGSMRADDFKPSRMEAAKSAARIFVEKQHRNTLIGVISFSDGAAVVQAPTKDREAIYTAINRLTTQRGTAIGRGIITSLNAILEQPADKAIATTDNPSLQTTRESTTQPAVRDIGKSAAIVLLSDGVSNVGPPPLEIIDQVSDRGIKVYTVGIGSPEGTVVNFEGLLIRVRLDEDTLKNIAEKTDASYFKADSETDLQGIYQNLSSQIVLKPEQTELTAGFTGLAVLLLLCAGIISLLWFNRLP